MHFSKILEGEKLGMDSVSDIVKICYSFYMIQMAVRCIYMRNSFSLAKRGKVKWDEIEELLNDMKSTIKVYDEEVEISTLFYKWSLPYLRKVYFAVSTFMSGISNNNYF